MKTAAIIENEIKVEHDVRSDVNREFLTFDVPRGWDDVKPLTNKILLFDDKRFTFSGWCSDTNKCFFTKPLYFEPAFAKILNN